MPFSTILEISSSTIFQLGRFVFNVLSVHLFISIANFVLNPACSRPYANPPAPANNSTTLYFISSIEVVIFLTIFLN